MKKLVALACMVSWLGFWVFGYLAFTADVQNHTQILVAGGLAGLGFLTGIFAYLRLCKDCPMTYRRVRQE